MSFQLYSISAVLDVFLSSSYQQNSFEKIDLPHINTYAMAQRIAKLLTDA